MKKQVCAIAFDDGRFTFRKGRVPLVGVITRLPSYLEGAIVTDCEIDGTDSSAQVVSAVLRSRLREQIRIILLDGIASGGFNIYDLDRIHSETGIPVLSVTRREPDIVEMESALRKHFADWEDRIAMISRYRPVPARGMAFSLFAARSGLSDRDALDMLSLSIVRGNFPEPLRMAHIFAGAVSSGESGGKA